MKRETTLIILGFFIAVTPFFGIPWKWKTYLFILSGLLIASIGTSLRYSARKRALYAGRKTDTYEENGAQHKPEYTHE